MIDLILMGFTVGVFYGGFYCGAKFHTLGEMFSTLRAKAKSLF